jgi:hypothetical protein
MYGFHVLFDGISCCERWVGGNVDHLIFPVLVDGLFHLPRAKRLCC